MAAGPFEKVALGRAAANGHEVMPVRTRILLSLIVVSAIFVGAIWMVRLDQAEFFSTLVRKRTDEWTRSVKAFLESRKKPLAFAVEDLAADSGLVEALEYSDRAKLLKILDDNTLKSRGLHVAWGYLANGILLDSHSLDTAAKNLDHQPIPGVDVAVLAALPAASTGFHFYFELPEKSSESGQRQLVEVRGARALKKVENADGSPYVSGYFFAGCLLEPGEIATTPLPSPDDHLKLASAMAGHAGATERTMTHAEPLQDWKGRDIAQLIVSNDSDELTRLEGRGEWHLVVIVSAVVALLTILFAALSRSILRPLRWIHDAIEEDDLASIEPLARQKSEFGMLADLIRNHFKQRTALILEMNRRMETQQALRDSDEMLRHSQKLEAVGRLAGGVAHDFNNLLTAIIGYAALLRQRLDDPAAREQAGLIHQAGEQAAGLTRQLLAFSRKQLLQPRLVDLNVVIRNLHRLLQRIIGEHIEILTEATSATGCVRADPGQIEQVIINLGVNARDAMPRGGRLTVRTVDLHLDGGAAEFELAAGDYVAIEVADTGEGMDAETRSRIFEPFFTTKGPGKGTGLGLATVYGIVKQSGGGIAVESEPGRGSTFRILLPQAHGTPDAAEGAVTPSPKPAGAESVLVVEDEEIVRELICEVLRAAGYRVNGTNCGSEALRIAREELEPVDLLISNVVMPGMNGAVVARRLHELKPKAKVLFVSGYSEKDIADQGLGTLAFEVMQKPFTPETLIRKVREVLDGTAAPAARS